MIDEEWYEDDYPTALEEEEVFLNTIWEECTADLRSKSTVGDFASFNSDFTSFNSFSSFNSFNSQRLLDRQGSQDSLMSAKSLNTPRVQLSVHSEEDDDTDAITSSSSSLQIDDGFVEAKEITDGHLQLQTYPSDSSNDLNVEPEPVPDAYEESILDVGYAIASPKASQPKSCPTIEFIPTPHHSPKSPMEQMLQTNGMDDDAFENAAAADAYNYSSTSSCSKRVDFSGAITIVENHHREEKRERILQKMKSVEDKVVQARRLLETIRHMKQAC
ncbi:MAG: hypothetical protein SGBAC_003736 [Bacillariaceae sp.]